MSEIWQALMAGNASVSVAVDRIDAIGPDTVKFLHNLVSQNISAMLVGTGAWTFLLQPQGKVTSLAYAYRLSEEHVVLLTEPTFGEALHTALSRYRIRTKCELSLTPNAAAEACFVDGIPQYSVTEIPTLAFAGGDGPSVFSTARIVAGWPAQPNEINERTIPNETGVLRAAVNFTKGCYVGQELVERIDSRAAATPRRLVRLIDFAFSGLPGAVFPDASQLVGAELLAGSAPRPASSGTASEPAIQEPRTDQEIHGVGGNRAAVGPDEPATRKTLGTLTSAVVHKSISGGVAALAYVSRSVAGGETLAIAGTQLVAVVAELHTATTTSGTGH